MFKVEMVALVWLNSTTNTAFTDDLDYKLWAIVKDGIVVDGWMAVTEMEAMVDNPGTQVVLVTPENYSFTLGNIYRR